MRELKFRAWNKYHRKMHCVYEINFQCDIAKTQDDVSGQTYTFGFIDLDLMQYTGLKDNLGNPIFEGDILRVSNDDYHETADYEVVYCADDGYPAFDLKGFISDSNSFSEVINSGLYNYVVAGNIYQMPEPI